MRRCGATIAAATLAIALTACSGGLPGHPSPVTAHMLRGTELPSFSCDAHAVGKAVSVLPRFVVEVRICPIAAPDPFNRPSHPISLARGSTRFESLLSALSLPDAPAGQQQVCPEYAELLPTIIARTATAALVVHIPADSCGHSLPAVRAVLNTAKNTTSAN